MKNKMNFGEFIGPALLKLESVGCLIDVDTCEVYPEMENGYPDWDNSVSLYETDESWFDALSENDINLLINKGLYEILKQKDMAIWLCKEGSEKFTIIAPTLESAESQVEMWNAVVLGEYNPKTNSIKI